MAYLTICDENKVLSDWQAIRDYLEPHGIWYEQWSVEGRLSETATSEEILSQFAQEISLLKQRGGYLTADVINVNPETPGLDAMLERFNKEHTHSEDEVRFVIKGRGVFHIHPENGSVFSIEMEAGDMINVPRGTLHWFNLCSDKTIQTIRLFEDATGWTPHYIEEGVHQRYQPLCLSPSDFKTDKQVNSALRI